ncbi:hypothetical protein Tco_0169795 [Tanacetum coccineum]
MPYPRFTKVIIKHFISKDKTISMRNKINLHIICDDSFLGTLKFISKTKDYQQYGALIPDDTESIQDYKILKLTRLTTTLLLEKVPPRKTRKYKKVALLQKVVSLSWCRHQRYSCYSVIGSRLDSDTVVDVCWGSVGFPDPSPTSA